jgi:hypothetical protein
MFIVLVIRPKVRESRYMSMKPWWNDINREKLKKLGEIPVTVPLFPLKIPHGLTQARTRASAVRGRWLTV